MMMQKKHTVLVLDRHDDDFRKLLRVVLKREGYHVVIPTHELEAVECLQQGPSVSIVATDNQATEMSGWGFLHVVEKISPSTQRIMITSSQEESRSVPDRPGFLLNLHEKPTSMLAILDSVRLGIKRYDSRLTSSHKELGENIVFSQTE